MNKIYKEIATLGDKFRTMAFGLTTDERTDRRTLSGDCRVSWKCEVE